jgi:hypothetical protein
MLRAALPYRAATWRDKELLSRLSRRRAGRSAIHHVALDVRAEWENQRP